jgi:hypothetical protein
VKTLQSHCEQSDDPDPEKTPPYDVSGEDEDANRCVLRCQRSRVRLQECGWKVVVARTVSEVSPLCSIFFHCRILCSVYFHSAVGKSRYHAIKQRVGKSNSDESDVVLCRVKCKLYAEGHLHSSHIPVGAACGKSN